MDPIFDTKPTKNISSEVSLSEATAWASFLVYPTSKLSLISDERKKFTTLNGKNKNKLLTENIQMKDSAASITQTVSLNGRNLSFCK